MGHLRSAVWTARSLRCADLIQESSRDDVLSGVVAGANAGPGDLAAILEGWGAMSRVPDVAERTLQLEKEPMLGFAEKFSTPAAAELSTSSLPRFLGERGESLWITSVMVSGSDATELRSRWCSLPHGRGSDCGVKRCTGTG